MENSTQESHLRSENSFTYDSPYPLYAMALSSSPEKSSEHRIAVGSFIEEYNNKVDIVSFDSETLTFKTDPNLSFEHPYPPTKLMFHPSRAKSPDLLASSGDYLRLWEVRESSIGPVSVLNNSKSSEFCAPLTSFDWNEVEPRRIGTSSIDTTCTIWDIERGVVETQLIAHDKEVYDIAWGEAGVFASVSADGSVRIFDLRDKEHSTIVYESPQPDTPLLRLAWNKQDLRYMATILMDSNKVVILDIRSPSTPVAELERHRASVNAIAWAPQSCRHICSAGDDTQALVWELPTIAGPNGIDPMLAYSAGSEINQLQWSAVQPDWIAIAIATKMQLLKLDDIVASIDMKFKYDEVLKLAIPFDRMSPQQCLGQIALEQCCLFKSTEGAMVRNNLNGVALVQPGMENGGAVPTLEAIPLEAIPSHYYWCKLSGVEDRTKAWPVSQ
ncbi:hypothetical protein HHK36_027366 [Tetracentron sinense]|uniref:Uncharacterized protein n=1 Tax=Tetracentron sinense TaxID=13715 RepID=A0A835D3H4_TETSI|nr:hypothetical protein HHK36_027366 [Tetracentron sinense]